LCSIPNNLRPLTWAAFFLAILAGVRGLPVAPTDSAIGGTDIAGDFSTTSAIFRRSCLLMSAILRTLVNAEGEIK
jgi:hypothetical protein